MRHSLALAALLLGTLLVGCGDPVPQDYTPEIVVEAYLFVDEPIRGVRVYTSQSLADTFLFDRAMIRNAEVTITSPDGVIPLRFVDDSLGGRFDAIDTSLRVKPTTKYDLLVKASGKTMTSSTITPNRFAWVTPPKAELIYPGYGSETAYQDSLIIRWSLDAGVKQWLISVTCEDTSGYGQYLTPPTADTNLRIRDKERDDGTAFEFETTRMFFIQFNQSPTAWQAFKWYGKHTIEIYAPDANLFDWFKATRLSGANYNPLLGSINGGIGVFGSAYRISSPTFLFKEVKK